MSETMATAKTEMLRVKEAAGILGVSVAFLYNLMTEKKLPSYKIGGSRRIARQDLEAFIASCRQAAA